MKTRAIRSTAGAFNLIEMLVILALAFVLAAVMLPMLARTHHKSDRITCVNNLKQIGLSFRIWSGDNQDRFPMTVGTNSGGAAEVLNNGATYNAVQTWFAFNVMSNELSVPKILVCPTDNRVPAKSPAVPSNLNISYFLCLDASPNTPDVLLAGDRNLTNGWPATNQILMLTTNAPVGWTHEMHQFQGNVALSDGSVQQTTILRLQQRVSVGIRSRPGVTTNATLRLAMPE